MAVEPGNARPSTTSASGPTASRASGTSTSPGSTTSGPPTSWSASTTSSASMACSSSRKAPPPSRPRASRPRRPAASSASSASAGCATFSVRSARPDHYGLGPRQAVVTIATDGFDRYPSVLRRLDEEQGPMDRGEGEAATRDLPRRGRPPGRSRAPRPCAGAGTTRSTSPGSSSRAGASPSCGPRRTPSCWIGPAGARARDRPPHPGAAVVSLPGCVSGLVCVRCGRRYRRGLDGPCPACGPEGVLDIEFDLKRAARVRSPPAPFARGPGTPGATTSFCRSPRTRGGRPASPAGRRSWTPPGWPTGQACGACS